MVLEALSFLKKIFYVKSFEQFTTIPNEAALKILDGDKEKYLQKVDECVAWSQVFVILVLCKLHCPISNPQGSYI